MGISKFEGISQQDNSMAIKYCDLAQKHADVNGRMKLINPAVCVRTSYHAPDYHRSEITVIQRMVCMLNKHLPLKSPDVQMLIFLFYENLEMAIIYGDGVIIRYLYTPIISLNVIFCKLFSVLNTNNLNSLVL